MENQNKGSRKLKAGFLTVMIVGIVSAILVTSNIPNKSNPLNLSKDDDVGEWHLKQVVNSWDAVGENDPGDEGWLSSFHLDYAQVAGTVLAVNATDWEVSANARGYVDADGVTTDLKSEDPSFVVARCVFDDEAKDGGSWNWSRYRVNLTISGDETIAGVGEYDNSSTAGDAVISGVNTANDHIYINFYWDDGVDGYRVTDDGTLTWSIAIYEKY
jgi:hypothetical protein